MFRDLLAVLDTEISAQRAWDDAIAIHSIDRRFSYSDFQESARYTARRMTEAGLAGVEILQAPADGSSLFGDWRMPMGWKVEEATFDLVFPDGAVQRVADRRQLPLCIAMWSGPTAPEGVEAELVLVEDVNRISVDLRGKIAFIGSHPHAAKKRLADAGAIGILTDYLHANAGNLPDAVAWINSFSDDPSGWAFQAGDTPLWSFQVSPREGARIRARFRAGEALRGRAVVHSHLAPGTLPAITAVVPGTGQEEVVLVGHQFEEGACDNASGVACMLEAARAIQSLVQQGKLPQPQRSIRLLFVSECYTNLYFWEKTRRHRHTVAGLCLDTPVTDPAYAVHPMQVHVNQHAQASYSDALILHLMQQVMAKDPLYAWGETPYAMTDNLISDTTLNIPCPWIGAHSRTWHTSADTKERLPLGPTGLAAAMTAAYAYLIASAGARHALDFAHLAAARGRVQIAQAAVDELGNLAQSDLDDAMLQVQYIAERQADAVGSVLRLLPRVERANLAASVRPLQRDLRRAGKEQAAHLAQRAGRPGHTPQPHAPDPALDTLHPKRLVLGPVCFDRIPFEERRRHASPRWSGTLFSLLSWLDGKRSLDTACHLTAREHRRLRTLSPDELVKQIDPNATSMLEYCEFLKQWGYVNW